MYSISETIKTEQVDSLTIKDETGELGSPLNNVNKSNGEIW